MGSGPVIQREEKKILSIVLKQYGRKGVGQIFNAHENEDRVKMVYIADSIVKNIRITHDCDAG